MAIVTAEEARAYIPTISGTGSDALLNTLIARFDSIAGAYMGFPKQDDGTHSIESGTYTEYLDGGIDAPDGRELMLMVRPVVSITSLFDDPDQHYDDSADQIASTDFILYGIQGRLVLRNDKTDTQFSGTRRGVRVIYVAGYTSSTMPQAIEHACCLQVAHWFNARGHIGKSNVSSAGQSAAVMNLSLLPEVKEALAAYRLPSTWVG